MNNPIGVTSLDALRLIAANADDEWIAGGNIAVPVVVALIAHIDAQAATIAGLRGIGDKHLAALERAVQDANPNTLPGSFAATARYALLSELHKKLAAALNATGAA